MVYFEGEAMVWLDDEGINNKDEGTIGNLLIIIIILKKVKYTFDRELNANSTELLTSIK